MATYKTLMLTDEELLVMLMALAAVRVNPEPSAKVAGELASKVTAALHYSPPVRRSVRAM